MPPKRRNDNTYTVLVFNTRDFPQVRREEDKGWLLTSLAAPESAYNVDGDNDWRADFYQAMAQRGNAQMKPEDVILEINGAPISETLEDMAEVITSTTKLPIVMKLQRGKPLVDDDAIDFSVVPREVVNTDSPADMESLNTADVVVRSGRKRPQRNAAAGANLLITACVAELSDSSAGKEAPNVEDTGLVMGKPAKRLRRHVSADSVTDGRSEVLPKNETLSKTKRPRRSSPIAQVVLAEADVIDLFGSDSEDAPVLLEPSSAAVDQLTLHRTVRAGQFGWGHIDKIVQLAQGSRYFDVKLWWGATLHCTQQWLKQQTEGKAADDQVVGTVADITYSAGDLYRLTPGIYLNDTIIDIALRLHYRGLPAFVKDAMFSCGTFVMKLLSRDVHPVLADRRSVSQQLANSTGEENTKKSPKPTIKLDPFTKAFITLPFNEKNHWSLAVLCYPALLLPRDSDEKVEFPVYRKAGEVKARYTVDHTCSLWDSIARSVSATSADPVPPASSLVDDEDTPKLANASPVTGCNCRLNILHELAQLIVYLNKEEHEIFCAIFPTRQAELCARAWDCSTADPCLSSATQALKMLVPTSDWTKVKENLVDKLVRESWDPEFFRKYDMDHVSTATQIMEAASRHYRHYQHAITLANGEVDRIKKLLQERVNFINSQPLSVKLPIWEDAQSVPNMEERRRVLRSNTLHFAAYSAHRRMLVLQDIEYRSLSACLLTQLRAVAELRLHEATFRADLQSARAKAARAVLAHLKRHLLPRMEEQLNSVRSALNSLLSTENDETQTSAPGDLVRYICQHFYAVNALDQADTRLAELHVDLQTAFSDYSSLQKICNQERQQRNSEFKAATRRCATLDADFEKAQRKACTPPAPCILFLDSLKAHRLQNVARLLRQFLELSYLERYADNAGSNRAVFDAERVPAVQPGDIPRQANDCDCGVFLIQYFKSLTEHNLPYITQDDIAEEFATLFPEDWFDSSMIAGLRHHLLSVLMHPQSCT